MVNFVGEICLVILMICGTATVIGLVVMLLKVLWKMANEDED